MILQMPALLVMLVAAAPGSLQASDAGRFATGGSMTLRLEYASGSICDLTVRMDGSEPKNGRTSVGLSCDGHEAGRPLAPREAEDFLRLARDARLYQARGIGRDGRGGDAWLATLKVTDAGRIVVLVISGNPEFDRGPRQELSEFLRKLFAELRPGLNRR